MGAKPEAPRESGSVVPLHPERMSLAEQHAWTRKRARVALPTVQRDFSELWREEPREEARTWKRT